MARTRANSLFEAIYSMVTFYHFFEEENLLIDISRMT